MDAIDLLVEMVEIESLSGSEQKLAEHLVLRMHGLGYEAHVDEAGNAVGVRRGASADTEREIVLLGHMDTVPGRIPVRVDDGELWGRGSVDAKGPLATFVMAASEIEFPPGMTLTVVGAVEEEAATSKGARHRAALHRPEACIIGEPSSAGAVTLGYKGRVLCDVRAEQPGGHSAGPQGGVGETAVRVWNGVQSFCDELNTDRPKLFDQLMPSLRSIETSSDGLTDVVDLTMGFRLPPDYDTTALKEHTRALAGDGGVEFYGEEVAWSSPRTTPLARAFTRALRDHDLPPRFKHKTGTSDMNVLGPVWGCPIVAYGPGDSSLDHAPDERISLVEYQQAIDVLESALGHLIGS